VSVVTPTAIRPIAIPTLETTKADKASGEDLGHSFAKAFADARDLQTQATESTEKFASGDPAMGIHEVMIASEKANIAVRYATTLKNKCVEAYRELMNTQV
jgi:flagellar hook-basal body complex protein FliE